MLPGKTTRVVATPKNQVVGLGDDNQFFSFLHERPALFNERQAETYAAKRQIAHFKFRPATGG